VAFELKVGDIAPPVQTRWGWYVIRLIEKNDQRVRAYAEVRDDIRRSLIARKSFLEDRRILQELRKKADVVEKLPF
jgi:peptidyl-prolyl cis-trans isomerase C